MSRTYRHRNGYVPRFTHMWYNEGRGRYWKRQLSKARRRFIKMKLLFGRGKEPTHYESEVNWKGW